MRTGLARTKCRVYQGLKYFYRHPIQNPYLCMVKYMYKQPLRQEICSLHRRAIFQALMQNFTPKRNSLFLATFTDWETLKADLLNGKAR